LAQSGSSPLHFAVTHNTAQLLSQGNIELMPKKQVFYFKLAPRPEQISGKGHDQAEDRKHRVG